MNLFLPLYSLSTACSRVLYSYRVIFLLKCYTASLTNMWLKVLYSIRFPSLDQPMLYLSFIPPASLALSELHPLSFSLFLFGLCLPL